MIPRTVQAGSELRPLPNGSFRLVCYTTDPERLGAYDQIAPQHECQIANSQPPEEISRYF